jgi:hypothetical protein
MSYSDAVSALSTATGHWPTSVIRRRVSRWTNPRAGTGFGPWTWSQHLVADRSYAVTFFCGGSRNHAKFVDLFDGVFVLKIDLDTMHRRLDDRPADHWAGPPPERELLVRWHQTQENCPANGIAIDGTAPLPDVVSEILRHIGPIYT